jgi:hypothetical protein
MKASDAYKIADTCVTETAVDDLLATIQEAAKSGMFYVGVRPLATDLQVKRLMQLGYAIEYGRYGALRISWKNAKDVV